MNKLQKYYIVREHPDDPVRIIGTNSGQAFVEAAAEKHMKRLKKRITGNFHIVEITKLNHYL